MSGKFHWSQSELSKEEHGDEGFGFASFTVKKPDLSF